MDGLLSRGVQALGLAVGRVLLGAAVCLLLLVTPQAPTVLSGPQVVALGWSVAVSDHQQRSMEALHPAAPQSAGLVPGVIQDICKVGCGGEAPQKTLAGGRRRTVNRRLPSTQRRPDDLFTALLLQDAGLTSLAAATLADPLL